MALSFGAFSPGVTGPVLALWVSWSPLMVETHCSEMLRVMYMMASTVGNIDYGEARAVCLLESSLLLELRILINGMSGNKK